MKLEPPKLEGNTPEGYLASARKIVRWGSENLSEVRRAMLTGSQLCGERGILMEESLQLVVAALITVNCAYFNRLIESELRRPIVIQVPDREPYTKEELENAPVDAASILHFAGLQEMRKLREKLL